MNMSNNLKKRLKICFVLGTRPELIKCSPVIKELIKRNYDYTIFHTNQHYDENMDTNFWKELGIEADHIVRYTSPFSFGGVVDWLRGILFEYDAVLVQGDTNSVLAGAMAARFCKVPIGHIEAGIRSKDMRLQEEANRQMVARIADYNFCPTEDARWNLMLEQIDKDKIYVTGNTIVDCVYSFKENISKMVDVAELPKGVEYVLLTMHRAELVDNHDLLLKALYLMRKISEDFEVQIIYPIHPRTKKMLNSMGVRISQLVPTIILIPPVGFLEMLALEQNAKFIVTDSGGVQEETCILRKPCFTIRDTTERPETLDSNNTLIKPEEFDYYLEGHKPLIIPDVHGEHPYGDGRASSKIIDILENGIGK